jgi:hypothetical protein
MKSDSFYFSESYDRTVVNVTTTNGRPQKALTAAKVVDGDQKVGSGQMDDTSRPPARPRDHLFRA